MFRLMIIILGLYCITACTEQVEGVDLHSLGFVSPSGALSGQSIQYDMGFTIENNGTLDASSEYGHFFVAFYISTDFQWDASDVLLGGGRSAHNTPLASGANTNVNFNSGLTIPTEITDGDYYLLAVIDESDVVDEVNESNNVAVNPIKIGSFVDLVAEGFNAPASAAPGEVIGDSISVNVLNSGTIDADSGNGYISTAFYLSTDAIWDDNDTLLLGGRESTPTPIASKASIPVSIYSGMAIPALTADGQYYLLAVVDELDYVTEDNESNNIRARSITITTP